MRNLNISIFSALVSIFLMFSGCNNISPTSKESTNFAPVQAESISNNTQNRDGVVYTVCVVSNSMLYGYDPTTNKWIKLWTTPANNLIAVATVVTSLTKKQMIYCLQQDATNPNANSKLYAYNVITKTITQMPFAAKKYSDISAEWSRSTYGDVEIAAPCLTDNWIDPFDQKTDGTFRFVGRVYTSSPLKRLQSGYTRYAYKAIEASNTPTIYDSPTGVWCRGFLPNGEVSIDISNDHAESFVLASSGKVYTTYGGLPPFYYVNTVPAGTTRFSVVINMDPDPIQYPTAIAVGSGGSRTVKFTPDILTNPNFVTIGTNPPTFVNDVAVMSYIYH